MAHKQTINWIARHLIALVKALISACGGQMGLDPNTCSTSCRRRDKIVFFPEQTVRYSRGTLNRFGDSKNKNYRNDGILFVRPGSWGLKSVPPAQKSFTVGVEIKELVEDLQRDDKIIRYLGWTDFYFIMAPKYLEGEAIRKVNQLGDARIGVLIYSGETCWVSIIPQRQQALYSNRYMLAMQAILGANSICYSAEG